MADRTPRSIQNPESVRRAVREFDEVGRDAFKYGTGSARKFQLVEDGHAYDAKAVLAAAFAYEFPDEPPLATAEFLGRYERLGLIHEAAGYRPPRITARWDRGGQGSTRAANHAAGGVTACTSSEGPNSLPVKEERGYRDCRKSDTRAPPNPSRPSHRHRAYRQGIPYRRRRRSRPNTTHQPRNHPLCCPACGNPVDGKRTYRSDG